MNLNEMIIFLDVMGHYFMGEGASSSNMLQLLVQDLEEVL